MGADTQKKSRDRVVEQPIHLRLLWRDCHCAAMLGIGRATWLQLNRRELTPAPIKVGTIAVRTWRAAEVSGWVLAGCPQRSLWTWKPAVPAAYDKVIERKRRELESIENELAASAT